MQNLLEQVGIPASLFASGDRGVSFIASMRAEVREQCDAEGRGDVSTVYCMFEVIDEPS
jgi:hypothetical protein